MGQKKERVLEIFYRLMMGEGVSVSELADEYEVSTKSISRDMSEIKNFVAEHRELLSNAEIKYVTATKKHYLKLDHFLSADELFAITKMMIGCRCFFKEETLEIIDKLKNYVSEQDRSTINDLILKEMYHFNEIKHDCDSVVGNLWRITDCIKNYKEITISYYKMNRDYVERRVRPIAITFSDYYFYMIGYQLDSSDDSKWDIRYYRVDRIVRIMEHRVTFVIKDQEDFDEGDLMSKIQYMFPGTTRHIKFAFSGPSVQAVLDRIPTAKLVEKADGEYIIEADVIGPGVDMFLLSQGAWVRPIAPKSFVDEMRGEVEKMMRNYEG